jgi:hypothetical protein
VCTSQAEDSQHLVVRILDEKLAAIAVVRDKHLDLIGHEARVQGGRVADEAGAQSDTFRIGLT